MSYFDAGLFPVVTVTLAGDFLLFFLLLLLLTVLAGDFFLFFLGVPLCVALLFLGLPLCILACDSLLLLFFWLLLCVGGLNFILFFIVALGVALSVLVGGCLFFSLDVRVLFGLFPTFSAVVFFFREEILPRVVGLLGIFASEVAPVLLLAFIDAP